MEPSFLGRSRSLVFKSNPAPTVTKVTVMKVKKKIPDYLTSLLLSLFFKFKSKTSLKIMYNWIFLK